MGKNLFSRIKEVFTAKVVEVEFFHLSPKNIGELNKKTKEGWQVDKKYDEGVYKLTKIEKKGHCNWLLISSMIASITLLVIGIILLYNGKLFVLAILEATILGLVASWAYTVDIRSQGTLFLQRVNFFFLHFICALAGWIALFILLKSYVDYDTWLLSWLKRQGFAGEMNYEIFRTEPSLFIFLVALAVFGITDQLANLVYRFAKNPSK